MLGAGTVINPIIKIVTTVAILAAVGFFIGAAGESGARMAGCDRRGQKLVHKVQSDRGFALSYADSLAAQSRRQSAERVRDCVKRAGFKPAAMQRCRDLADRLLFG